MKLFTSLVTLSLIANSALAKNNPYQCVEIEDNKQRLACYDNVFLKEPPQIILKDNTQIFGLEQEIRVASPEQLSFKLKGNYKNWYKGKKITLDNGQVWKITSSRRVYYRVTEPSITIKKGSLGSYLMNIDDLNHTFKVRRVLKKTNKQTKQ